MQCPHLYRLLPRPLGLRSVTIPHSFTRILLPLALSLKQPPKWLRWPISALFRFGGQLVSVGNLINTQGHAQSSIMHLRVVCTEPGVREGVNNLRNAVQDNTLEAFSQKTAEGQDGVQWQGDVHAAETWKALLSSFRANAWDEFVTLLGYSKEEVKARVGKVLAQLKESQQQRDQPQEEQLADADNGLRK